MRWPLYSGNGMKAKTKERQILHQNQFKTNYPSTPKAGGGEGGGGGHRNRERKNERESQRDEERKGG